MAQPTASWKVCVCLSVTMLAFSGHAVVVRRFAAKSNADPLLFCLVRDLAAFPVLVLSAIAREGRLDLIRLSEIPLFFLLGFLGVFGGQYFYIMGIYYAGADIVSLFSPAIPVFTSLLAITCCLEKVPSLATCHGFLKVSGITATVVGAIVILLPKHTGKASFSPVSDTVSVGIVFALATAMCGSMYIITQKRFVFDKKSRWSQLPIAVTAWTCLFGVVCLAVPSVYSLISCSMPSATCDVHTNTFPFYAIIPLIYSIFITSALCYQLLSWCNKHGSPLLISVFYPLQTPATLFLAYVFLNEHVSLMDGVGGGVIALGLAMVVYSDWYEKMKVEARIVKLDNDSLNI